MSSSPGETVQVIGVLTGIVQKGPDKWQAVVTPDGSQYNRNLWTKNEGLLPYLQSQIGNRVAFLCSQSHWERNGQPVTSLWIDQLGPPAIESPALAGPPPPAQPQSPPTPWEQAQQAQAAQAAAPPPVVVQPQVTPMAGMAPSQDSTETKIHRQTASKVVAHLLAPLPPDSWGMDRFYALCEQLVYYYDNGMKPETLDELIDRAMPEGMDPPPLSDEDIPF